MEYGKLATKSPHIYGYLYSVLVSFNFLIVPLIVDFLDGHSAACTFPGVAIRNNDLVTVLIQLNVLYPTQHKMGHFRGVLPANLFPSTDMHI